MGRCLARRAGACHAGVAPGVVKWDGPRPIAPPPERRMTTLQGKTLFITGASRGIGKAIALRAARDGANVVIAAKTNDPHPKLPGTIHTAAAEMEAGGGR